MSEINEEVLSSAMKDIKFWDVLFYNNQLSRWAAYYGKVNGDQKKNVELMKRIVYLYTYRQDVRRIRIRLIDDDIG